MKRTALNRKTPLKRNKIVTSNVKSENESRVSQPNPNVKNKIKSRGLKGHGRNEFQVSLHSRIVDKGCFACNFLNEKPNSKLCIHHPRGRNKGKNGDVCEEFVICLCQQHHDSTMCVGFRGPSVHGNKRLFLNVIGTEAWCVLQTYRSISMIPSWLSNEEWDDYLRLSSPLDQANWICSFETDLKGYRRQN